MVEFAYDRWKRVVIHEINKLDVNDLARLHALGVPAGGMGRPFLWANGMIFEHNNMAPTREVIKDQLQGTIHWSSLQFAFMPQYQNEIKVESITLQVGNVNGNRLFFELADWLKRTYKDE